MNVLHRSIIPLDDECKLLQLVASNRHIVLLIGYTAVRCLFICKVSGQEKVGFPICNHRITFVPLWTAKGIYREPNFTFMEEYLP